MVKKHLHLLAIAFAIVFALLFISTVNAQERVYHVDHEWVKIWINQDGTIDLFYDMSLTLDSGPNINYVFIGQSRGDFTAVSYTHLRAHET